MNEEEDRAILLVDVHRMVGDTEVITAEEWGLLLKRCLAGDTLSEMGKRMGVGKDRIRQFQHRASFLLWMTYEGTTRPRERHPVELYYWKQRIARKGWARDFRELHRIVCRAWNGSKRD